MSEQEKTVDQEALIKASQKVYRNVYIPAFLKAAADAGIQFQTEDQLANALKIAALVRLHEEQAVQAQAAQGEDMLSKAASALESLTFGEQGQAPAAVVDPEVKQALAVLSQQG